MSWSNITKHLSTFVNATKHTILSFLLKEDGFYLLLEDGGRIILEESGSWDLQTKHTS